MNEDRLAGPEREALELKFGPDGIVIRKRYEAASKLNDVLIGLWFVIGSVFFFFGSLQTAAIALFLVGSVQLLARLVIRIARDLHLQKAPKDSWDY